MPQDTRALHLLTTVAGQIGMFIQRQRAELALRTSEERLSYATRATSDVVFDCALDTKELWLSEAALRNFGYDVNQVTFDWWAQRLHPDDSGAVLSTLQAGCAGDQSHWTYEYRFACSNQHYAHVFHRLFILRDDQGKAIRVIGSMMDISERVRNEEALREAKISAEAAARAKTTFLANMSHEIRTPLTALLGFADLLLDPDLENADRLGYATIIRNNGEHLLAILNDVLDVGKLESGKLTIEQINFSPAKVLAEVASLMRVKALEKGLTFSVSANPPLPAAVRGDPTRLRQVLFNLVSNAVKFTEAGSVHVIARCEPAAAGAEAQLEVRVRDTGIGMDAAQVQRLFQPFSQADSSTTRRFGGTGLGLAICGPLVRAMGGAIEVQTKPQVGSEFTLRLPVQIALDTASSQTPDLVASLPPGEQQDHGSVLLAEDGPDNQRLISTLLRKRGFEVEIVDNGLHAVERALSAAGSGAAFDVILMDMQMPRLDGYQATARLRASGYQRPILALTAHAMEGERKRCIEAGCDDHLAKPIERRVLLRAVASHVERAHLLDAVAPRAASELPSSPRKIAAANDLQLPQLSAAGETRRSSQHAPHLVSSLADDAELSELVKGFVAGLPAQLTALRAAVEKDDREQLLRLLHQMKGAAGGYGFPSISEAARALERALRADPAGPLPDAWQELLRVCESTQPRPLSARPKPVQVAPASVLVIEDSALIRELIAVHLGAEGMQLRFAACGREGLASAFEQTPDVIMLDIELPDMSGLNVCRELKQDVRTANVPVLFLTGTEDNVVKAAAFELGAIDYVTKPFNKIELRARVRSALRVKRYQDLLTTRAQLDGLTGLWNRAYFDVRLREEISAAQRHHRPLSIAMLDLDHFKKINDSYGHPFGDYVLQTVATALVRALRTGDVACRYGGEELVVILRDSSFSDAAIAAERMRSVIAELTLINRGQNLHVTVSIGVTSISAAALASANPKQAELLIEAADSALYQAKHEGRARVVLSSAG
jgi:diguanylate cyclase (GGDEF)-like protein